MEHAPIPYLRETLLFLALAGILIPLLQRLRFNQVLGFLVVGVLVGPHGFALWVDRWPWLESFTFPKGAGVTALGELGVIFLMFLIGLELSVPRMWALRRWVFLAGSAQVLLCAVVLGTLAFVFGNAPSVALVLGLVLSLSSTAVVMQLLTQQRSLAKPLGQATFAILMLQDLAVVPLVILVDILGNRPADGVAWVVGITLLKSVCVVLLIFFLGRKPIRLVFRTFARQHQPEVFMALTLLIALSTAAATALAGLSLALGGFLAGLLLAETEYRHEVELTIEPFKGLLMGLFFMSVGMSIDLREVLRDPVWIALSVLGLMLVKTVLTTCVMRAGGLSWGKSLEGGMLLAQGGEFAFIVVGAAAVSGVLGGDVAQFMLLVVSLSLVATPLFAKLGAHLGQRLGDRLEHPIRPESAEDMPDASHLAGHIIIAGHGRVGLLLADLLHQQHIRYVAVEHDASVVAHGVKKGRPVLFGNAARPELLHKLHAESAIALVITMDHPAAAMHTGKAAREAYPNLPIYARSRDEQHARDLLAAGATAVVPETLEAGLQLSSFALQAAGHCA
jgi:CPA2 family monovalent cation:H+ antiporter-2